MIYLDVVKAFFNHCIAGNDIERVTESFKKDAVIQMPHYLRTWMRLSVLKKACEAMLMLAMGVLPCFFSSER